MIISEEIKRIKYLRMKPEERFLYDILTKVELKYNDEKKDSLFLILNGKILFEQYSKFETVYVHYTDIWLVLSDKYKINDSDIKILISDMLRKIIKLKVHIVWKSNRMNVFSEWKTLNLKV